MEFSFLLEDDVKIKTSSFSGKVQVWVNGKELKRSKEKGRPFKFTNSKNNTYIIKIRKGFFGLDPIPRVFVNNYKIDLAKDLRWYEYGVAGMPIVLVFRGGVLGGAIGACAVIVNLNIFRREFPIIVKFLFAIVINILSVILYLTAAGLIWYAIFPSSIY